MACTSKPSMIRHSPHKMQIPIWKGPSLLLSIISEMFSLAGVSMLRQGERHHEIARVHQYARLDDTNPHERMHSITNITIAKGGSLAHSFFANRNLYGFVVTLWIRRNVDTLDR